MDDQTQERQADRSCMFAIGGLIVGIVAAILLLFAVQSFLRGRNQVTFNCEQLPTVVETLEIVEAHLVLRDRIEAVGPGEVSFEIDTDSCPGKAGLVIWYATNSDRDRIRNLINGETFFGIPYHLRRIGN